MNSIPYRLNAPMEISKFFYNEYTKTSLFLARVKPWNTKISATAAEMKNHKHNVLALDIARCADIYCPKYGECARSFTPEDVKRAVYSPFIFGETGCEHYIGGEHVGSLPL
jgi:hypothetical protein